MWLVDAPYSLKFTTTCNVPASVWGNEVRIGSPSANIIASSGADTRIVRAHAQSGHPQAALAIRLDAPQGSETAASAAQHASRSRRTNLRDTALAMSANVDLVRSIFADWERGEYRSIGWAHPEIE